MPSMLRFLVLIYLLFQARARAQPTLSGAHSFISRPPPPTLPRATPQAEAGGTGAAVALLPPRSLWPLGRWLSLSTGAWGGGWGHEA